MLLLAGRLDAFSRRGQVQGSRQRYYTLHNGRVLGIVAKPVDKRAIDLERVYGEALQVTQARVAGPEVVDGEPDAQRLETSQGDGRSIRVLHRDTLGDLEFEAARIQPG